MSKKIDQIQVRIDSETKKKAKEILDTLGLDISTAVKMLFRQIINTKNLPLEIRDENGFTLKGAEELRASILDAEKSGRKFKSGKELIKDALF